MAKKIVWIGGTWDLFHVGHLNVLQKAKAYGDFLIVAISSDELVKKYKLTTPIIPLEQRKQILKSLYCVDLVVEQKEFNDINLLKRYKVNMIVVGTDWRNKKVDSLEWMKENGQVIYLPHTKGVSTSKIKKKIIKEQDNILKALNRRNQ